MQSIWIPRYTANTSRRLGPTSGAKNGWNDQVAAGASPLLASMAPASALALGRHEKVSNEESSIITALKKIWAAASINAVWRMIFHFSCGPMGGSYYIPHIPCKCHQRPNGQRCYTWNPFFLFQRVNQNFSPTCGPLGSGKPIFQAFPHSWEKNFQTFIFTKHANFQGQTSQKKLKLISYLYQFIRKKKATKKQPKAKFSKLTYK